MQNSVPAMPAPKRVRLLDRQASAAGQIFAPRQLLSYMYVMNAENAGAFFCPALP
ncbi:hypothetical protein [Methylotuvimicrobium sp. KM2]|jgi:hypothetical protein|uniref:hypothetical protein n=1 Tax=Methylotuvimicrobium sp. KM2 TaxID=3133976 RepID=UPI003100CDEB